MNNYKIIRLKYEDYQKCGNIWDMELHHDKANMWGKQIESGEREVYIYVAGGEFLGEIAFYHGQTDPVYSIPGKRIYISRMIVKKECRNCGIGGILIDYMCRLAGERGYSEVSLGVNIDNLPALHLYKKNGFTELLYHGTDQWGEHYKLLKKL